MPLEGTCILSVRLESLKGNEQALAVARCALLQVNSRGEEQQHHRQERNRRAVSTARSRPPGTTA